MPKTTSVTLRMDAELKRKSERLFEELGMNMTTAVTVFLKAAVRQGRIPFEIAAGVIADTDVTADDKMSIDSDIGLELADEPVWELDV